MTAPARRPNLAAVPLVALVRAYQVVLGPLLGGHCRFHPTCSVYAIEALGEHGAVRGMWLTVRRLMRCHPFGSGGFFIFDGYDFTATSFHILTVDGIRGRDTVYQAATAHSVDRRREVPRR